MHVIKKKKIGSSNLDYASKSCFSIIYAILYANMDKNINFYKINRTI